MTDREVVLKTRDDLAGILNAWQDQQNDSIATPVIGLEFLLQNLLAHLAAHPEPAAPEKVGEVWLARGQDDWCCVSDLKMKKKLFAPGWDFNPRTKFVYEIQGRDIAKLFGEIPIRCLTQRKVHIMQQVQPDGSTRTWWERADGGDNG